MEKIERGNTKRVTAVFTDPDTGSLVDPTSPTMKVYKPDGTVYQTSLMSHDGTGRYSAEIETAFTADLGYYLVQVYGTYDSKQVMESDKIKVVEVI